MLRDIWGNLLVENKLYLGPNEDVKKASIYYTLGYKHGSYWIEDTYNERIALTQEIARTLVPAREDAILQGIRFGMIIVNPTWLRTKIVDRHRSELLTEMLQREDLLPPKKKKEKQ